MRSSIYNITARIKVAILFIAILSSQNTVGQIRLPSIPTYGDYSFEYLGALTTQGNNYKAIDKKAKELGATHYYVGPSYARINQVGYSKVVNPHNPRATVSFYRQLSPEEAEKKRLAAMDQEGKEKERETVGWIIKPGNYYMNNDTLYLEAINGLGEIVGKYTCSNDSVQDGYFSFERLVQGKAYESNHVEGFFENGRCVYEIEHQDDIIKETIYSGDIEATVSTHYVTLNDTDDIYTRYKKSDIGKIKDVYIKFNEYFSDLTLRFKADGNVSSKVYCGQEIVYDKRKNVVDQIYDRRKDDDRCPDIKDFDFSPFYSYSEIFRAYYPPK